MKGFGHPCYPMTLVSWSNFHCLSSIMYLKIHNLSVSVVFYTINPILTPAICRKVFFSITNFFVIWVILYICYTTLSYDVTVLLHTYFEFYCSSLSLLVFYWTFSFMIFYSFLNQHRPTCFVILSHSALYWTKLTFYHIANDAQDIYAYAVHANRVWKRLFGTEDVTLISKAIKSSGSKIKLFQNKSTDRMI